MKNIRITLLNLVAAVLFLWAGFGWLDGNMRPSTLMYVGLLIVLLFIVDQLFRMSLGSLKRIWLIETIFIILSLVVLGIVRYIF